MIDVLFSFHDATPPMLLMDGPLRCPPPRAPHMFLPYPYPNRATLLPPFGAS